jgi:hypothetical protein
MTDEEYWEQWRVRQQAQTDSRRDTEDKVAALNRAAHEARET